MNKNEVVKYKKLEKNVFNEGVDKKPKLSLLLKHPTR